jgi:hypothetical protein
MVRLKWHKSRNTDCILLKLSTYLLKLWTKIRETLEIMKKSVRLNMASLAFTTQATPSNQMFPGLIQHLWCDLFECSRNLVPQISNVSWVLSAHTVLDVTPNKKVRWAQVGWTGRPSSGSPRPNQFSLKFWLRNWRTSRDLCGTPHKRLYSRCILVTHWNCANHWTRFALCCGVGAILKYPRQWRLYWSCSAITHP